MIQRPNKYAVPFDFTGILGRLTRGNKMYGSGMSAPNPQGNNQHTTAAMNYLKRRRGNNLGYGSPGKP